MEIVSNKDFANALYRVLGGEVVYERHRAVIWKDEQKLYLVRVSKKSIRVRKPKMPVAGIVFFLKDFQIWGIVDSFDKKTLGTKDANKGIWE